MTNPVKHFLPAAIARAEKAGMTNVAAMLRKHGGAEKMAEKDQVKIKLASDTLLEETIVNCIFDKMAGSSNDEIIEAITKIGEELDKEELNFSTEDEALQFADSFTNEFINNLK